MAAHIDRIDPYGHAKPKSLNDDTKTLLRALSTERAKLQKGWSLAVDQCDKEYARAEDLDAKLKEALDVMQAWKTAGTDQDYYQAVQKRNAFLASLEGDKP